MTYLSKYSLFFTILLLSFTACEKSERSISQLGTIVSLNIQESAEIDGAAFIVAFDELLEDSRCPTGAECFWEGLAEVNLLVNETQTVTLIKRAGYENLAVDTLDGFIYSLLEVNPYPDVKATLPIPSDQYSVEIQVDRL